MKHSFRIRVGEETSLPTRAKKAIARGMIALSAPRRRMGAFLLLNDPLQTLRTKNDTVARREFNNDVSEVIVALAVMWVFV